MKPLQAGHKGVFKKWAACTTSRLALCLDIAQEIGADEPHASHVSTPLKSHTADGLVCLIFRSWATLPSVHVPSCDQLFTAALIQRDELYSTRYCPLRRNQQEH